MKLPQFSFRARMTMAVTGLIFLLMLVTAIGTLTFFTKEFEENLTSNQTDLLALLADDFDNTLFRIQEALALNAKVITEDILSSRQKTHDFLYSRTGLRQFFKIHVHLYDNKGNLLATAHDNCNNTQAISQTRFFKRLIATGKPQISDPTQHGFSEDDADIIFATPVIHNNKIAAVMTGSFSLYENNPLTRFFELNLSKNGFLRLITKDSVLLLHVNEARILQKVSPGAEKLVDEAFRNGYSTGHHTTIYDLPLIASMQRLKAADWVLAASYPEAEAYFPAKTARNWLIAATICGMALAVPVVLLMMRRLTRPLYQLAQHVAGITEKTGAERFIDIPAYGEIKQLTTAFNDMLRELAYQTDFLLANEQRYRIITESAAELTYWQRLDGSFEFVSPSCRDITGYSSEELKTNPQLLLDMVFHADKAATNILDLAYDTDYCYISDEIEYRIVTKDGVIRWLRLTFQPIFDKNNLCLGRRGSGTDITERKQLADQVSHLVLHDLLTGLPNRSLFTDRLSQTLVAQQSRNNPSSITIICFFGIDRFKLINDTLGHEVGDHILIMTAERLRKMIHSGDTLCRFGGDVFAMILPERESKHDAITMAYTILASLNNPFSLTEHHVTITGSIGIAVGPEDGGTPELLLKNAEAAMYEAKRSGKNCFRFYKREMNLQAAELLRLDNSMPTSLERGDFYLQYQPQLDIANKAIIAVEALLRWRHPDMGMISPDRFIPVAEDNGFIIRLGAWVLKTACEQAASWQQNGLPALRVAVNISSRQFSEPDFIDLVAGALQSSGLDPHLLELELTESLLVSNEQQVADKLTALKAMGVYLAIDDFGTGYSSLSYLKHFPLDRLKIDKSFINDILTDQDDAAITDAIISMAHSLKLKVIAEGVESREQLLYLEDRGCDEIQGYYLSRPLSELDLMNFMKDRSS